MTALTDREKRGMAIGLVGIAMFSLTLPATRVAVAELDPFFITFGRASVAAACAIAYLALTGVPIPNRQQLARLAVAGAGVVIGFPLFMTLAMQWSSAAHGAVVLGLLPLATALAGAIRFHERPSPGFWASAVAGTALVVAFALQDGAGSFSLADFSLACAVVSAAIGYAEGGRLSRELGAVETISWALVVCLPVCLVATAASAAATPLAASAAAWTAFGYVSLFSMFAGFFFWYRGLALGGIARVGQVQLLQPFMTLLAAAVIAGERITLAHAAFAAAVVATVMIGRRMPVRAAR